MMKQYLMLTCFLFLPANLTQADTLTWGGTNSSNWNTADANWDSGGGAGTDTWDNTVPDDAVFGATGAGTVTLTEAITAGSVTFTGGDYTFGASGGSLSFSTLDTTGAGSAGFDGVLAGLGTITSAIGGNWSGDNSAFNGTVNHSAGTVTIDNANSLGTGIFNLSGGLLNSSNQALLNSTLVINATGGRISALGVNDRIRFSGVVNFNSGGSGVQLGGDLNNRTMAWESGSTFGGDAASVKIGRSTTFIRSGTNLDYTGDFVIERTGPGASILDLGDGIDLTTNTNNISFNNAGAANQNRVVQVNDGGTVTLNNIAQGHTVTAGLVQLQTSNSSTLNVAGDISGGGDLTIAGDGSGTTVFSGTNTYSGPTAVDAGTLLINGSTSTSSAVTVGSGATLGGAGTVGGNVTLNSGSFLSPGASPGTLTMGGTVDLSGIGGDDSGSLIFELGTSSDQVILSSGALTIGTGLLGLNDFDFTIGETGLYTLFDTTTLIDGALDAADLTGTIDGFNVALALGDGGNDLILNVIPEPGSIALLGVFACGWLIRRRRE